MELIYQSGEIAWMTGVLVVGVVYSIFAIIWGKDKLEDNEDN